MIVCAKPVEVYVQQQNLIFKTMKRIFSSKRSYKIWHYSISHNSLIIRSEKQYFDVEYENKYDNNNTIDLEFSGVEYINLPSYFEKIEIRIVVNIPEELSNFIKNKEKVFQLIVDSNTSYFIVASSLVIGESDWGADKDKLSDLSLNYKNIILKV